MEKIGSKLKELRLKNNFSINTVIKKLSEANIVINKKTIYRWENNSVIPTLDTIRILSYIYNTDLSTLYEDTKYFKVLNENEFLFINMLRLNTEFSKIVNNLMKL